QPLGNLFVSPRGTRLAYVSTRRQGPTPHDLFVQPAAGGAASDVTQALDRRVKRVKWQGESTIYLSATDGFFYRVYRIAGGKAPQRVDLRLSGRDFDFAPHRRLAL